MLTAQAAKPQPADADTSAKAAAGTSSVRMKVSPVTYSGPLGHRKPSAARMPATGTLHASAEQAPAQAAAAPAAGENEISRTSPPDRIQEPAAPVLISTPALPLSRLPDTAPGDVLAARGCAKRLLALVEKDILAKRTTWSVAV